MRQIARLIDRMYSGKSPENVAKHITMPSVIITNDIATSQQYQRLSSPNNTIIIFDPQFFAKDAESQTILITPEQMNGIVVSAYLHSNTASYTANTSELLAQIAESSHQQDRQNLADQKSLEQLARETSINGNGNAKINPNAFLDFVKQQFPNPYSFVRELIQNSDGSMPPDKENRIDIYLEQKDGKKTLTFEDHGCGMDAETIKNVYFQLFSSENEDKKYAAGMFGLGAKSIFILGHEQVEIDTLPIGKERGLKVKVDSKLIYDDNFQDSTRTAHGTTTRIILPEDSTIDLEEIVKQIDSCKYVRTPVYLHDKNGTRRINEELATEETPESININTHLIQGFLRTKDGEGKLTILQQRLPVREIKVDGYQGVINCDELQPILSRDEFVNDGVLEKVLEFVETEAKRIKSNDKIDMTHLGLESKLEDFFRFMSAELYDEKGNPRIEKIKKMIKKYRLSYREFREDIDAPALYFRDNSFLGNIVGHIVDKDLNPITDEKNLWHKLLQYPIEGGKVLCYLPFALGFAFLESPEYIANLVKRKSDHFIINRIYDKKTPHVTDASEGEKIVKGKFKTALSKFRKNLEGLCTSAFFGILSAPLFTTAGYFVSEAAKQGVVYSPTITAIGTGLAINYAVNKWREAQIAEEESLETDTTCTRQKNKIKKRICAQISQALNGVSVSFTTERGGELMGNNVFQIMNNKVILNPKYADKINPQPIAMAVSTKIKSLERKN